MTPVTFKAIRERAGLTQSQLASLLRLADGRAIRRYESGDREVSGPVSLLMEMLDAGDTSIRAYQRNGRDKGE